MQPIIPFKNIHKSDVAVVGGKAASLGEMVNEGFPVPDGFVVTSPEVSSEEILVAFRALGQQRILVNTHAGARALQTVQLAADHW